MWLAPSQGPVHKFLGDIEAAILIEVQSIGNIPFSKHRKILIGNIVCKTENIFGFVSFVKWSYFCHFTPSLSMLIILLVIVLNVV